MDRRSQDVERVFAVATAPAGLNQALFQVTHGLYILTAASGGRLNGQCLDALMQVTSAPPRIAIGVNKRSLTHEMIAASGRFGVNVLDREDPACAEKIRHFGFQSGRAVEKFKDILYLLGESGVPVLPDAVAFYECSIVPEMTLDLETHSLFVALVERGGAKERGEPLTYNEYRRSMRRRTGS
jgi:flavin reductase (DIM6/NTAB) family NADH-FMN oxidoreductase RutF